VTDADSKFIFYTSNINEISQQSLKSWKEIYKYKGTHKSLSNILALSPKCETLISTGADGEFCFYKVETKNPKNDKVLTIRN
jgi:WD40 repeat protein